MRNEPPSNAKPPPAKEVPWVAKHVDGRKKIVKAQTWFFARKAAMAAFGCEPTQVDVVLKEEGNGRG